MRESILPSDWKSLLLFDWLIWIPVCVRDDWTEREVMYVSYVGEIFLRMLKALILPLIVPSLITAVGSLDLSLSGGASKVEETKYLHQKYLQTVNCKIKMCTLTA